MKVELRARPVAYFSITRRQLDLLKSCAKAHYDGECQRTIARAGAPIHDRTTRTWDKNGILTVWGFGLELDADGNRREIKNPMDTANVSATSDHADLLAKVTEEWHPGYHGEEAAEIRQLHRFFYELIGLCNRAYGTWKLEVDL